MVLVIRKAQMAVFEQGALQAFEDRTYVHLLRYFPRHFELLGEAQMRRVIQQGWVKAKSYELTDERCVRSYIDLMCFLGGGFDIDPLLPWAAEILQDRSIPDEVTRGDRLYGKAMEYVDQIAQDYVDPSGKPITARFIEELRRIRQLKDDALTTATWPAFADALHARLVQVFPAKSAHLGAGGVTQAVTSGAVQARQHGIAGERGVTLMVALRFILGVGFASDPLLPWVSDVLTDGTLRDERQRASRLFAVAVSFLKRWWGTAPGLEA